MTHESPSGALPHFDAVRSDRACKLSLHELGYELISRLQAPLDGSSYASGLADVAMLSRLRDSIEPALERGDNRFSTTLMASQFNFVRHMNKTYGLPLRGACHLEIGSGAHSPFGRMFTHVMAGVRRAWCLELDSIHDQHAAVKVLARYVGEALIDPSCIFGELDITAADVLANTSGFDLRKIRRGDIDGIPGDRLSFVRRSVESTGLESGSVDVVISQSVLEHLPNIDSTFRELSRVVKKGGFAIHGIDVSDHRRYGDPSIHPLEFLTIDSQEPIVHLCNRLRLTDYEKLFRDHGFVVLDKWCNVIVDIPPSLRSRLTPPWSTRTDDDLRTMWGLYGMVRV